MAQGGAIRRAEGRSTLVDVLRAQAEARATQTAYTFLNERGVEVGCWTYAELHTRAKAIAARLQSELEPGAPVLLLYPPGLEFIAAFAACLCAGVVAVPVFPPRRNQFGARLRQIASDVGARLVLTGAATLGGAREALPELRHLPFVASEEIDATGATSWRDPGARPETLALVQYTSGSTGTPKGVMLSHANLLHNEAAIQAAFEHDEHTVVLGWLPVYHDMGLIGNVLQPLFVGATCVLMPPAAFLLRPARWLQAITRYRATTSGAPDFAYDLCARKIGEEDIAGLDLSSWTLAYSGAEPVRAATLERFARAFAPCGFRREAFYPCYGLAEATLFVSGGAKRAAPLVCAGDDGSELVGCGHAWAGQELRIVDPETRLPVEDGAPGEIWLRGPGVAQGYWRRPDESAATFGARLASGEGPFLRTGDLGLLRDGELFVQGRLKDLIILRGVNHHASDLEASLEGCHPALRAHAAAAFSVEDDGAERLVIAAEVERAARDADIEQVATAVRAALSEAHDVQVWAVVLLRPGGLPRTSSGKLRRSACRAAFLADALDEIGSVRLGRQPPLRPGLPHPRMGSCKRGRSMSSTAAPLDVELTRSAHDRLASLARLDRRLAWVVTLAPLAGFLVALALIAAGRPLGPLEIGLWLGMHLPILAGVEVGFHRHFAHRSFKAHRRVRQALAILGSMAFQGPVIWWAATHRRHHAFSDQPKDPHSPHLFEPGLFGFLKGQLHAHMGWLFVPQSTRAPGWDRYGYDMYRDRDIFTIHSRYFLWLGLGFVIPGLIGGLLTRSLEGALMGVLWGGFVRIFMMNHVTYWCINSVTHTFGQRPFLANDKSVNNAWLALPTLGQSWHNNHHAFPASAVMSLHWWQIDVGGWIVRALQTAGLAWDVHTPGPELLERKRAPQAA